MASSESDTLTATELPDFYNLPPFFTLQPNLASRAKQLAMWTDILVRTSEQSKKYEISLADPIFENKSIQRRVSQELFDALLEDMVKHGRGDKMAGGGVRVYTFTKRELADMLFAWATAFGRLGGIETVFALHSGEDTEREKFHGLPSEMIVAALKLLEEEGRCEVFGEGEFDEDGEDQTGVKFFGI